MYSTLQYLLPCHMPFQNCQYSSTNNVEQSGSHYFSAPYPTIVYYNHRVLPATLSMSPTTAKEIAERIASRLHDRQPRNSIPRLLLEILAEELKIYRLHMEERANQARHASPDEDDARDRRERGHRRRQRLHKRHHATHSSNSRRTVSPQPMMSGGGGSPGVTTPKVQSSGRRRGRRGRCSPSLGPPPIYQPRVGLTMGFASHIRACINYEAKRLDKEERRKRRRAGGTPSERRGENYGQSNQQYGSNSEPGLGLRSGYSSPTDYGQGSRANYYGSEENEQGDMRGYQTRSGSIVYGQSPQGCEVEEMESEQGSMSSGQGRSENIVHVWCPHSFVVEEMYSEPDGHGYQQPQRGGAHKDRESGGGYGEPSWSFANVPRDGC